jgi:hypothetical protein
MGTIDHAPAPSSSARRQSLPAYVAVAAIAGLLGYVLGSKSKAAPPIPGAPETRLYSPPALPVRTTAPTASSPTQPGGHQYPDLKIRRFDVEPPTGDYVYYTAEIYNASDFEAKGQLLVRGFAADGSVAGAEESYPDPYPIPPGGTGYIRALVNVRGVSVKLQPTIVPTAR